MQGQVNVTRQAVAHVGSIGLQLVAARGDRMELMITTADRPQGYRQSIDRGSFRVVDRDTETGTDTIVSFRFEDKVKGKKASITAINLSHSTKVLNDRRKLGQQKRRQRQRSGNHWAQAEAISS